MKFGNMSRIGKKPIVIPEGTEVTVSDGVVVVKGKGGKLLRKLHPKIEVKVKDAEVVVISLDEIGRASCRERV